MQLFQNIQNLVAALQQRFSDSPSSVCSVCGDQRHLIFDASGDILSTYWLCRICPTKVLDITLRPFIKGAQMPHYSSAFNRLLSALEVIADVQSVACPICLKHGLDACVQRNMVAESDRRRSSSVVNISELKVYCSSCGAFGINTFVVRDYQTTLLGYTGGDIKQAYNDLNNWPSRVAARLKSKINF